jgi:hypothetical protein
MGVSLRQPEKWTGCAKSSAPSDVRSPHRSAITRVSTQTAVKRWRAPFSPVFTRFALRDLFNPMHASLVGRYHASEELQDPEQFAKAHLIFTSDETLPKCWTDVHYRDEEAHHRHKL